MKKPKKTDSFHSIRGERIKGLYQDLGLSQGELAEKIGMKQSAISEMVNGRRTVTETTARAIVQAFPQYRFEWIMGYDDYRTREELNLAVIRQARYEGNLLDTAFIYFAKLNDYSIELPDFFYADHVDVEEAIDQINHGFTIRKGNQSRELSLQKMRELENEICDYIGFRLDQFVTKGR